MPTFQTSQTTKITQTNSVSQVTDFLKDRKILSVEVQHGAVTGCIGSIRISVEPIKSYNREYIEVCAVRGELPLSIVSVISA